MPNPFIRFLCLPDIDRAIGGVKQLYRHCEHLTDLGFNAAVVTQAENFRPNWFSSTAQTISLHQFFASGVSSPSNTIIVLPETYIGVDLRSFYGFDLSSYYRVIFNQNAYYTFGSLNQSTPSLLSQFYDSSQVLQVLSVSQDTEEFLLTHLGIDDNLHSRIINAVEPIFSSSKIKKNVISWMPRKNPDHTQSVLLGLQRSASTLPSGWQLQPLHDLTHQQVAESLNSSSIFLSFGHPEGFGLPVAEAMASGNWVVGYTGGGGKELFGFGACSEITFGDWSGFSTAIKNCLQFCTLNPRAFSRRVQQQSNAIKSLYSHQHEKESIMLAWNNVLSKFNSLT